MQAILTKYICPTNTKGPRIIAKCETATLTIAFPHEARTDHDAHCEAALALIDKMKWKGGFASARLPGSLGFAHVPTAQAITY